MEDSADPPYSCTRCMPGFWLSSDPATGSTTCVKASLPGGAFRLSLRIGIPALPFPVAHHPVPPLCCSARLCQAARGGQGRRPSLRSACARHARSTTRWPGTPAPPAPIPSAPGAPLPTRPSAESACPAGICMAGFASAALLLRAAAVSQTALGTAVHSLLGRFSPRLPAPRMRALQRHGGHAARAACSMLLLLLPLLLLPPPTCLLPCPAELCRMLVGRPTAMLSVQPQARGGWR